MNDIDETKPSDGMSNEVKIKVKKSPEKTNTITEEDKDDSYCQCKLYKADELSVGCENCDLFWHLACVGLKGLKQSMVEQLVDWKCPNCFVWPHARATESAGVKDMRAMLKDELSLMTPVIKKNVEEAVQRAVSDISPTTDAVKQLFDSSVDKAVDKAVNSYAAVAASSQKKVMEDMSRTQASTEVIEKVVRKLDVDQIERQKKRFNVCINKVPESHKKSPRDREKDDLQYCTDSLEIEAEDIVSCYRAGKKNEKIADFSRPLIVKLRSVENVSYYTLNGKGFKTKVDLWINPDLCRSDRKANFEARQEAEKRKQKKSPEEKKEEEKKKEEKKEVIA